MSVFVTNQCDQTAPPQGDTALTGQENIGIDDLKDLMQTVTETSRQLQDTHQVLHGEVARLQHELAEANVQLRRSRSLAALGGMAAGIAHEIRNPLGSIQLYVQLLAEDVREDPNQLEICRKIDRAVVSLDAIVRDVLLFARDYTINIQPLNTGELLDRALEHCEAIITRGNVTVIRETSEVFDLQADQTLFTQALSNVLRNAVEAMIDSPAGGDQNELRLSVACRRMRCPDGHRHERIVFGVEDTGPGISQDVVNRMFNPFFTTRPTGTGLGLAIVHRIVEAHGGHIGVSAGRQRGTRIELCLQSHPSSGDRTPGTPGISGTPYGNDCEASEAYIETFTSPIQAENGS